MTELLQAFFLENSADPSITDNPLEQIKLVEPQSTKVIDCGVCLEDNSNVAFKIANKTYYIRTNVKMEPIISQITEKTATVDSIVLHSDQQMLELHSNNSSFIAKLYQKLKRTISHKGFNDYFKPLKRLGKGGFATVYLIESKITGEKLAAKVFGKQGQKLQYKGKQSLQAQIQNLKLLRHPNIIRFEGIYETDNLIYLVTEYLPGGTLVEFMRGNSKNIGDHIINILMNILQGLKYLKSNQIMHRDIKPQNIVLRKDDNKWVLVDFGLAAFSNQAYLYDRCGTMGYMAPEILQKKQSPKPYTETCDMYSLGIVCYELIMGCLPFKVEMENMYNKKVTWVGLTKKESNQLDPQIVNLLKGLLEIDPAKRWTPQQCLECQFLKNPKIIQTWKIYDQKIKNQRYESILKPRPKNVIN